MNHWRVIASTCRFIAPDKEVFVLLLSCEKSLMQRGFRRGRGSIMLRVSFGTTILLSVPHFLANTWTGKKPFMFQNPSQNKNPRRFRRVLLGNKNHVTGT